MEAEASERGPEDEGPVSPSQKQRASVKCVGANVRIGSDDPLFGRADLESEGATAAFELHMLANGKGQPSVSGLDGPATVEEPEVDMQWLRPQGSHVIDEHTGK
eukprot:952207-Amphidinium_carterae.1